MHVNWSIFQAKIIYKVPFAEDELENIKSIIQSNLYRYLGILLKGRQKFEEECLNERSKGQAIDQASPSSNFSVLSLFP